MRPSASAAALQTMSLMMLAVLFPKQRAAMPMGGSGSKQEQSGAAVGPAVQSTAVLWIAAAAAGAPKRVVLRNCTSSPVMRPIR